MKRLLRRINELSWMECGRFAIALALVILIRLGLWLLPYRWIQTVVVGWNRRQPRVAEVNWQRIRSVIWAVEAASRRVPRASCLTQALTAQVLLSRIGHPTELRWGVTRQPDGQFAAHAWLELNRRVLIGGRVENFGRFIPLERSNTARSVQPRPAEMVP
jgi:hypothetical protein